MAKVVAGTPLRYEREESQESVVTELTDEWKLSYHLAMVKNERQGNHKARPMPVEAGGGTHGRQTCRVCGQPIVRKGTAMMTDGGPRRLGPRQVRGASMIDMLTPERQRQLRVAAKRLAGAQQERDRLIREAVAEGGSLREVAEAVGLSHPGIKKIVERA